MPSGATGVAKEDLPVSQCLPEGPVGHGASETPHPFPAPLFADSPWRFLSVDYSQMELHILAYLSNDTQLLSDLGCIPPESKAVEQHKGSGRRFDTFQMTASRLFGCEPSNVTRELRSVAKTVTYGMKLLLASFLRNVVVTQRISHPLQV